MKPAKKNFDPQFYYYPYGFIYSTALVWFLADVVGILKLHQKKAYFMSNPDEISRFYLLGRLLAGTLGAIGVGIFYVLVERLFTRKMALCPAGIRAVTPLFVREAHFMMVNVPAVTLMMAASLAAVAGWQRP